MKTVALLGGLALLVAAGVLLYQIRSTKDAVTAPSTVEAPLPAAPPPAAPIAVPPPPPLPVAPRVAAAPPPSLPVVSANPVAVAEMPPPPPPTGGTRFANPRFMADPTAREGVTLPEATRVAEGGVTPIERRNAVDWLMSNGNSDSAAILQRVRATDPDPGVRTAAEVGINILTSRFPHELMNK